MNKFDINFEIRIWHFQSNFVRGRIYFEIRPSLVLTHRQGRHVKISLKFFPIKSSLLFINDINQVPLFFIRRKVWSQPFLHQEPFSDNHGPYAKSDLWILLSYPINNTNNSPLFKANNGKCFRYFYHLFQWFSNGVSRHICVSQVSFHVSPDYFEERSCKSVI